MEYQTKAIHGGIPDDTGRGAVNYPIYLSSTFCQEDMEHFKDFVYSRGANPTRAAVERLAADLEGARFGLAFATGMAATSNVFDLLQKGDNVLINSNVYGGTWRFVSNLFERRGLTYEIIDDFNTFEFKHLSPNTRAVFLETPSNPLLAVTDIRKVSRRAKEQGLLVIVDNTFLTSYFQKPLELGADIVVYSATKYYAGHSDLLAGLVLLNDEELYQQLKFCQNTTGGVLSPFDSFLLMRGIKTLGVRMDRHQANAEEIASYLEGREAALKVFYPGLTSNPGYEIQRSQASGSGGVLSFLFNQEEYDMEIFVKSLKLFGFAVSLGGVESLICRPATMTHESYSAKLQEQIGIRPNLLRLAVGIEDKKDLIQDLEQAITRARK